MLLYNIVEEPEFSDAFDKLELEYPILTEIKRGLDFFLSRQPFDLGEPIPRMPVSAYGAFFVCKSTTFDIFSYPVFKFYYRIVDDAVYLIGVYKSTNGEIR